MNDYSHRTVRAIDEAGLGLNTSMPIKLERGGLFLCQCGHADIVIDFKRYHITKADMVVAFPFAILQILNRSEDFEGEVLSTDLNFFASIQIREKSSYYLYIKDNPCISLNHEEWERIMLLKQRLLLEKADVEHPLMSEINLCMMNLIVYEVVAIYIKRKPIKQQRRSRNEKTFDQFIYVLFNNYQTQRSLDFYAAKQSITPRHLSMIVKRMSGMTAGEWIVSATMAHIKLKLHNLSYSIMDISYEMNFPTPSFFSQYFKKHSGMSPSEFRRSRSN